jgi:hypothetical protein
MKIPDPFAAWKVLSIQCYPDSQTTMDTHNPNRRYINGPEAFLVTLLAEYCDAHKRLELVRKHMASLVLPQVRPSNVIVWNGIPTRT